MKKIKTLVSLLLTAILCIGLASCSLDLTKKHKNEETTYSEGPGYPTQYYDPYDNYYTYGTDLPSAVPVTPTTNNTPAVTKPTAPPTTQPPAQTTTAPVTTTVPVTTTTASATTTAAPVTTTQPPTTVPTTAAPTTEPTTLPDIADSDFEAAVNEALNQEREAHGLQPLTRSKELSRAAKIRAEELATLYSHTRPDGSFFFTVDENVKAEIYEKGYETPEEVMAAWMEVGPRDIILSKKCQTVGTGCYYDSATDTYYWVQLFGE